MLEVKKIYKCFNNESGNQVNVFNGLSLNIQDGEIIALLGHNGCGKTTLFNIVAGVVKQDKGDIILNNKNLNNLKENQRSSYISKVYQDPARGISPSLTILENMSMADKKGKISTLGMLVNKKRIEYYKSMLGKLGIGLEDKLDVKVKYLSGGQRQALSLLMATMKQPKLLLLDEHTAALDPKTSKIILDKTLEMIREFKITTIMISHNVRDAIKYSDRVIMLNKGRIVLDIVSNLIDEDKLMTAYNEQY